mmetsp:Transcript_72732/g.109692  ORF Transcript_72732/g.109692 Transcript_72732/m.109692 type:complete len:108 (+) Transcript_72732:29-352(+)
MKQQVNRNTKASPHKVVAATSPIKKKTVKPNCNFCSTPRCPKITNEYLIEFHSSLGDPHWAFDGQTIVNELEIDTFGSNFSLIDKFDFIECDTPPFVAPVATPVAAS